MAPHEAGDLNDAGIDASNLYSVSLARPELLLAFSMRELRRKAVRFLLSLASATRLKRSGTRIIRGRGSARRLIKERVPMAAPASHEITQLLLAWSEGDQAALEKLMPLVYAELHRLAKRY